METITIIFIIAGSVILLAYLLAGFLTLRMAFLAASFASAFTNVIDGLFCEIFGEVFGVRPSAPRKPNYPTRKECLFALFLWPVVWYQDCK